LLKLVYFQFKGVFFNLWSPETTVRTFIRVSQLATPTASYDGYCAAIWTWKLISTSIFWGYNATAARAKRHYYFFRRQSVLHSIFCKPMFST